MDLLQESMQDLLKWVEEGKIKSPAVQPFPFEKVADAHRALESGNSVGKLILKINANSRLALNPFFEHRVLEFKCTVFG